MLDRRSPVWDVRGGSGKTIHGQREYVPRASETAYPLPGLRNRTYHGIDDGAHMAYA